VSRYQKGKQIWILLKQGTVSGSGIGWTICKSASRSRQITTPAPRHSVFLQAGYPSGRPTNSVKALKANFTQSNLLKFTLSVCAGASSSEELEPFSFEDIFDLAYRPRGFSGLWISKHSSYLPYSM